MYRQVDIKGIVKSWFTNHPWLKLIALILAVLLWFYIAGELRTYLR